MEGGLTFTINVYEINFPQFFLAMAQCEDKNEKCLSWAEKGECSKNPFWMWKNCCASCKSKIILERHYQEFLALCGYPT